MKQMVLIIGITLAFLLNGCGESNAEKKGKEEFQKNVQLLGAGKAKNLAETKFSEETVEEWIKELKEKGQWEEENIGKGISFN